MLLSDHLHIRRSAFAKINLGLRIVARRPGGYHEIRTVYQAVALSDEVEISLSPAGGGIEVIADDPAVPSGPLNLAYRAAQLWKRAREFRGGIKVRLAKRIPAGSGLGGASSDAAATILGLERLTGDRLDLASRVELAASLGSDVPFFLWGGRALGCGRGEEIYPLSDLPPRRCLIVFPRFSVSTAEAYREASRRLGLGAALTGRPKGRTMVLFGERPHFSLQHWGPAENDFEQVVFARWPELARLKRRLIRAGAEVASLTGSGSAVYAVFASARKLSLASKLVPARWQVFRTRTLSRAEYLEAVTRDE
jgi:4-diphosphocytidyl-2-C-methyl-D-erythritol kinase